MYFLQLGAIPQMSILDNLAKAYAGPLMCCIFSAICVMLLDILLEMPLQAQIAKCKPCKQPYQPLLDFVSTGVHTSFCGKMAQLVHSYHL